MIERLEQHASGHGERADGVAERVDFDDGEPRDRARLVDAIATNPAGVHEPDVGLTFRSDGVGHEVAEVRLRGAQPRRRAVERHAR